jgi:glycerol-3-phosphate dehydrogenase
MTIGNRDSGALAQYDIFIIGGGVNGCGIARDAAGRGYRVGLAEMNDLASGTSSASTKLIHGGLRYLEHYEFRLVREALTEREILWAMAPHIVRPMRFVLPHHGGLRPAWLLRLGLFLYDHIGGRRKLPPTRVLDLAHDDAGQPLKRQFAKAFEYSDCWVDDARLVVLNARDAAARGATILTRTKVVAAHREAGHWVVRLERNGAMQTATARLLVNAAGPWVDEAIGLSGGAAANRNVRLVQGSHVVVRKLFDHDRAYFFQNADGRLVFVIPYEGDFTLIGTTDRDYTGDPGKAAIGQGEREYLCTAASEYLARPVNPDDIVWSYSGIRPLYDDGASAAQEATRDYVLTIDGDGDAPRRIDVFGGKITTYRRLAEAAMAKIQKRLGARGAAWTAGASLPGGDFRAEEFGELVAELGRGRPFLEEGLRTRLARLYGTEARAMLAGIKTPAGLGRHFGHGLYEAELRHLIGNEWAMTAEDVLWRRTKLGLRFSAVEAEALSSWMRDAAPREKPAARAGRRAGTARPA